MAGRTAGVSILCVNAGSSSIKLAIHELDVDRAVMTGAIEGIGETASRVWLRDVAAATLIIDELQEVPAQEDAIALVLSALDRLDTPLSAVGHRVVHGGLLLVAPTLVDAAVLTTLRGLVHLAPLHLPSQIAAIEAVATRSPALPQVACFDTAFHRRMPEIAQRFPLPEWSWDDGICRFGFHGLSFEHAVGVLGPSCGRVVIAHLGNGASMAAVHDGLPVDTTMAFTPTAGLMMGTRTGDLDPGVLVHLMRTHGMSVDAIEHLVNYEAGLLGVSGRSADMHTLLDVRTHDPRADRAIAMFCASARKSVGALTATLGGIDQLVFTGGIGERSPTIRAEICAGLEYLGIDIDAQRNEVGGPIVSTSNAGCTVRVVPADENLVIARQTAGLTGHGDSPSAQTVRTDPDPPTRR